MTNYCALSHNILPFFFMLKLLSLRRSQILRNTSKSSWMHSTFQLHLRYCSFTLSYRYKLEKVAANDNSMRDDYDIKGQDYVFGKWDYFNIWQGWRHCLRRENEANKTEVITFTIIIIILGDVMARVNRCVKQKYKLWKMHLKYRLKLKNGAIYRRQVVNPRHQTLQGQSVAKARTPL